MTAFHPTEPFRLGATSPFTRASPKHRSPPNSAPPRKRLGNRYRPLRASRAISAARNYTAPPFSFTRPFHEWHSVKRMSDR